MSKYDPFTAFLDDSAGRTLRLGFSQIEEILGFPLPVSKKYPAWWSNNPGNNTMTKAWLAAGYQTEQVDVGGERVTFVSKGGQGSGASDGAPNPRSDEEPRRRSSLFGFMRGTAKVMPGVDLTQPADPEWGRVYDEGDNSGFAAAADPRQVEEIRNDPALSVSDKIRALNGLGMARAEIARTLGKRYQHVRNVLTAPGKAP